MMREKTGADSRVRTRATKVMNEGVELLDGGDPKVAAALFRTAASMDPTYFGPWFNLGLAYKKMREWQEGFEAFGKALALLPEAAPTDLRAAILWNLGITASIVEDWPKAHWVWRQFGHDVQGEVNEAPRIPMGMGWVRGPAGVPLLGERLDPVRMKIRDGAPVDSALPAGTVVVHDGERMGAAIHKGRDLPVFPVLAVLRLGQKATN
jgi:hypothetical protein